MNRFRQIIVRVRTTEFVEGDDQTIRGLCVPYGEVTTVDDGAGPYKEMFARGAFHRDLKTPHRVFLDFEHETGMLNQLGHGTEFIERDNGLHGVFKPVGEPGKQALEFVRAGVLTGLSVRALVLGPGRRQGDVLVRTACHLDRVALCREPAYAGAVVEALRNADPLAEPAGLAELRPPPNPELDARLRALGIGAVLSSDA